MTLDTGARRLLVLFDLDKTLVDLAVDHEVCARAVDAATGATDLLTRIHYPGRTDRWIATQAAQLSGLTLEGDGGLLARYLAAYTPMLTEALVAQASPPLRGVVPLLEALRARADTIIGIASGGFRAHVALKLAHAGLEPYFTPLRGAFGDLHEDRSDVFRAAAEDCGSSEADRLVFVGDTIHDVRAALEVNAVAIGVATGWATTEELRTAGAHAVLEDFGDLEATLTAIVEA